jgi:F0F1-type ATP synthase assembly protein I
MRSWLVGRAGFTRLLVVELVLSLAAGLAATVISGIHAGFGWSAGGIVQVTGNALLGAIFLSGTPGSSHVTRWIFGETLKWLVMGILVIGAIRTGWVSGMALAGGFCLLLVVHVVGIGLLLVRVGAAVP